MIENESRSNTRAFAKLAKGGRKNVNPSVSEKENQNVVLPKKRAVFSDITNLNCHQPCVGKAASKRPKNKCLALVGKPLDILFAKKDASLQIYSTEDTDSSQPFDFCVYDDLKSDPCATESTLKEEKQEILSISDGHDLPAGVSPFDLDDSITLVSEYAHTIFTNMRMRETKFPVSDFLSSGSVTDSMRAILIDWLVEVQETFELFHETLYLGIRLMDYYLQNNITSKEQLQLVGATALFLACKMEERQPPPISDFEYICDDAYTTDMFIEMEKKIFKALRFDINMPISYRFLRRFSRVTDMNIEIMTLARYILELSLQRASFIQQLPSKMAAACLSLAMMMIKNAGEWNANHIYHSGYKREELVDLMKHLNQMLIEAPHSKLQAVRTKYSHHLRYSVAMIKPLSEIAISK